jgi:hypothetical protein
VALTETIIEVFQGVGGTLGAGGGFLAAQVWRKFGEAHKSAKEAKKLAIAVATAFDIRGDLSKIEPETLIRELALKLQQFVKRDELDVALTTDEVRELARQEVDRLLRGSRSDLNATDPSIPALILRRLDELERRMSALEDDVDEAKKEDRKWAEQIREAMGRIEGQMSTLAGHRRER